MGLGWFQQVFVLDLRGTRIISRIWLSALNVWDCSSDHLSSSSLLVLGFHFFIWKLDFLVAMMDSWVLSPPADCNLLHVGAIISSIPGCRLSFCVWIRFSIFSELHMYDNTGNKNEEKSDTHRLVPHLGVEGCSSGSGRRVSEGCVREAWGQLRGVQRVRSPGIRRCWDQCCPCQIIWGSTG